MSNPLQGVFYMVRGFALLSKPGIRSFVIVPFLISVAVFVGLISVALHYFEQGMQYLIPPDLQWLHWLLVPLAAVALLVLAVYSFTLIANLLSAPFNGMLAQAVEEYLTGTTPEQTAADWKQMVHELPATLGMELRKLIYMTGWMLPCAVLLLIPVLGQLVWFLCSAWMLVVEYADFPLGNHHLSFPNQRRYLQQQRLAVLGLGSTSLLMTLIPGLNFFAMPATVAATTLLAVEHPCEKTPCY